MALSETKTYLVYNYSSSPVSVETKYESMMIDGGSSTHPSTMPFTADELQVINTKSKVFKIGLLWFDPSEEEDLYTILRIPEWKTILRDSEIEEILLKPTLEGLNTLLEITNGAYFERVRGVFIGLRNMGADLSTRVQNVIDHRYRELMSGQRVTSIHLTPKVTAPDTSVETNEKVEALTAELEEMKKLIAAMGKDPVGSGDPENPDPKKPSGRRISAKKE